MSIIDLHVHSTASDGAYSPRMLMQAAAELGLRAIAITDHDCMAGYREALAYSEPELISGVELSVRAEGREIHVLGYFCDPELLRIEERVAQDRDQRNEELLERLRQAGVFLTLDELRQRKPFGSIGRPLIASVLVERGLFPSVSAAFDAWLAEGRPYYVPRRGFTLEEAAEVIRFAGGKAVLAHPLQYGLGEAELRALALRCRAAGFSGLEALYSGYSPAQSEMLTRLARSCGLRITGGSDFHGEQRSSSPLGAVPVPYSLLEELRNGDSVFSR